MIWIIKKIMRLIYDGNKSNCKNNNSWQKKLIIITLQYEHDSA